MKKYWFKAKTYGWGWYPATWQGWLVLLLWTVLFIANLRRIDPTAETLWRVFPTSLILMAVLIALCWATGERPHWRWGKVKRRPRK